jgi:hypothetical protein
MIPGVSKLRAEQLARHYPSPSHFIEAMNDPSLSDETKLQHLQELLALSEKKIKCKKLSRLLHLIFTTRDPSSSLSLP